MRVWDFSHNPAVMIVTTTLRRVWTIDPDGLETPTSLTKTGSQTPSDSSPHTDVIGQVARSLPQVPLPERWDDELWRSTTHYTLLNQLEVPNMEESQKGSHDWYFTPLRHKVYETFNHVFADAYNAAKNETDDIIGVFKPPSTTVASIRAVDGKTSSATQTCNFDTDTFVYPIWIAPKTRLTFAAGESAHTYEPEGKHWTSTLWFRAGERVTITWETEIGEMQHQTAAVLALGPCEPRPLPLPTDNTIGSIPFGSVRPWRNADNSSEEKEDEVEVSREATHLARAIFLRAGNAVEHCTFDEIDVKEVEAEEEQDQSSQSQPEELEAGNNLQSSLPPADRLYSPLSGQREIRLLFIEPAASIEQELRTRLDIVSLDSEVEYEAISYTWGDPSDRVELRCNDASVTIPRNLEHALKKLRRPREPRRIWADSACINQQDIAERSQQVSIMRHIYQGATRVVAWLGLDEHDEARTAFSAVCDIVRIWRPSGERMAFSSYDMWLEPMDTDRISQVQRAIPPDSWASLHSLFSNMYFRRFWIIQELALGDSAVIVWGDHHVSWGLVGICAAWLMTSGWNYGYSHAPVKSAFSAFLIYVLPLAQKSGISMFSRMDLSALLGMTMGFFESTDARDRIYGLLGMSFAGNNPDTGLILSPDYSQSLHSVYAHAARRILEQDKHLRMLSTVQHGADIDPSWPSWVPRWDQPLRHEPMALQGEQGFYANGGELFCPSDESFSLDGLSLNVQGLLCDTVTEVADVFEKGNIGYHVLKKKTHAAAMTHLIYILSEEDAQLRASWSATLEQFTLFGFSNPKIQAEAISSEGFRQVQVDANPGKYGMRKKVESIGMDRAQNDHLAEFLLYWRERASWETEALRHSSMQPFWDHMDQQTTYVQERAACALNTFAGRRLFFFEDGRPGLGPAAMQPGDAVAVLFGGIIPFVLRPLDSATGEASGGRDGQWQLVGECFVPHLMQGEAVEQAGLLAEGTYTRYDNNSLSLKPEVEDGPPDLRFERKVGENDVRLFRIC